MNNFVVPQFIDVEDKILGPITVRQFIVMMVGGILLFILFKLLTIGAFIAAALLDVFVVFLFGFFKVNGRPFIYFLLNIIKIYKTPRVRVWRREVTGDDIFLRRERQKEAVEPDRQEEHRARIEPTTLAELSLIVNTGGAYTSHEG